VSLEEAFLRDIVERADDLSKKMAVAL